VSGALLLAALSLAATPGQEPLTFGAGVDVVYLDVFVSRDGEPVPGLTAENFAVYDEGVRQDVRLMELEDVSAGVVLVFDTSASLAGEGIRHLREAGDAVLDALQEGDRVALVSFDYSPRLRVGLTTDRERVWRELGAIRPQGSTTLYDGLYAGVALPTPDLQPLVVLFTDGNDTGSWLTADEVLEEVTASRALIQVVVVQDPARGGRVGFVNPRRATQREPARGGPPPARDAPTEWLKEVAARTGGLYWSAESTGRLKATFLKILDDMADRYVLAFEPRGVPLEGVHRLEVRLENARGDVRARTQYVIRR